MKKLITSIFLASAIFANDIPLIKPTLEVISDSTKCADEKNKEQCSKVYNSVEFTGIDWLDNRLIYIEDKNSLPLKEKLEIRKKENKSWLENAIKEVVEYEVSMGYENISKTTFLHQRYDIATLKSYYYSYLGGNHGMYGYSYIIADLKDKKLLSLDDIVIKDKKKDLAKLLLNDYLYKYEDEFGQNFLPKDENEKLENLLVDNFYFDEDGIVFAYNPYYIGPYSEGVINLKVRYEELKNILKDRFKWN